MQRYICVHGHFYQPPRENPWLESIELQDSAYPFHDWNERITAECYAPNGASRILDGHNRIVEITNNYARISFNVGPTLLSWMEQYAPDVYAAIQAADRESMQHFGGHGSAMAQVYNHMIMPLANRRDKYTQVLWGIRDFEHRFGRKPEGMWLAETAANTETLEVLADQGITFTVLSPYQAGKVRAIDSDHWQDVTGGHIDPTRAYVQQLPSGKSINLFFYDGPISQGVAFEGLLTRGENLANRLLGAFSNERDWPQLVHIGTDGETYGHHHHYGEMALAYALRYIEQHEHVKLTNYSQYLALHPPTHEVEIIENTSWSCYHGIERWRSNCGCNSGGHPGWNQSWRGPLRKALDWLRNELAAMFGEQGRALLRDPWAARNAFISVIHDRSPGNVKRFLQKHAVQRLKAKQRQDALKLLEIQRHAMLMYTSCGWFFDELSGIETVQVIQYAGRAIQLAEELSGESLEAPFLALLKRAPSNLPDVRNGREVYERFVKPAMVDLYRVGMHFAVSALFDDYGPQTRVYEYDVAREDERMLASGRARLAIGRLHITSRITWETTQLSFGVLHFGDHNLNGGIRTFRSTAEYERFVQAATEAFGRADLAEVIRLLDREFSGLTYSLKSLFRDEQRQVLDQVLDASLAETEAVYRQIYRQNETLIQFLVDLHTPLPRALQTAMEFIINMDLRRALLAEELDFERIALLRDTAQQSRVELDRVSLDRMFKARLNTLSHELSQRPTDVALLNTLTQLVQLAHAMPFPVDMWRAQNVYYELLRVTAPVLTSTPAGDAARDATNGTDWQAQFRLLGEHLGVSVPMAALVSSDKDL